MRHSCCNSNQFVLYCIQLIHVVCLVTLNKLVAVCVHTRESIQLYAVLSGHCNYVQCTIMYIRVVGSSPT